MKDVLEKDVHEDGTFQPSYIPQFTTAREFVDAKIEMLRVHMYIDLDQEDINHLYSLTKEYEINAAVKTIINKHWR